MFSSVQNYRGLPTLFVENTPVPGFAYITYRTENAHYADFAAMGCRLYSLPVFFATQTINETTQFPPIAPGIFEGDTPDFRHFDADMEALLTACPDAWIFPRVNLSLPRRWEEKHPSECCDFAYTDHHRASFSSDAWAKETCRLLVIFLEHTEHAPYRDHIIGYQLAGGNTEEWFPFDMRGSVGIRFRETFERYCADMGIDPNHAAEERLRFSSHVTASRLREFSAFAKKTLQRQLVIGCFYGYTMECTDPYTGHHALHELLDCPDIDFICSPVSYAHQRAVGLDHACMLPVDSLLQHGKLYFAENDTRTHLTKAPNAIPAYNTPIWFGPDADTSVEILKLHFARALLHGHAMWWFDMWGGWYADKRYQSLLTQCYAIAEESLENSMDTRAQIAVFVDERTYAKEGCDRGLCYNIRKPLGYIGAPYDIFLIDDYEAVKDRYPARIFLMPAETERMTAAAQEGGLVVTEMVAPDILRAYCRTCGVHIWCDEDAVVYARGNYLFVHHKDGIPPLHLPDGCTLTGLLTDGCMGQLYRIAYNK